jgi:tagaturonate reductase
MQVLPRLSREVLATLTHDAVDVPPSHAIGLPEKVVQFGTGAFLRGFVEYFVDRANRRGTFAGSIVAVSSTGSTRDARLNEQDGLYTLAIQGIDGAQATEHRTIIGALSRALSARDDWDAVLALARNPAIDLVVSNTTEVGIVLDESDSFDANPPQSFPGKLTRFLFERARTFDYAQHRGVVVLPCELIEDNGDVLRRIIDQLVRRWRLGTRFERWLDESVVFCNTLVDRIVPGAMDASDAQRVERQLGYHDDLLIASETYALFAIQGDDALRARLGFAADEARIVVTRDIRPYRERKVRLLNGAHTASVSAALLAGIETVRDAVSDERVGRLIRRMVFDEIIPSVDLPDADAFANEVLERFANPYIRHALIDITLYGTTKMRVRVVPSILGYAARTGRTPTSLAFGFAAYLAFMRGAIHAARTDAGLAMPDDSEGARIRALWEHVTLSSDESVADFTRAICADRALWGAELADVPGFTDAVNDHLIRILRQGVVAALDAHLTETALT